MTTPAPFETETAEEKMLVSGQRFPLPAIESDEEEPDVHGPL